MTQPERERRPVGEDRAADISAAATDFDVSTLLEVSDIVRNLRGLADHVDHFRARVLQDAIAEATSSYWLRRSRAFAAVGTPACDEIAQACRNAASVALLQDGRGPESGWSRE
jgi:hypothetical protein